jgi:hypothetical protein
MVFDNEAFSKLSFPHGPPGGAPEDCSASIPFSLELQDQCERPAPIGGAANYKDCVRSYNL